MTCYDCSYHDICFQGSDDFDIPSDCSILEFFNDVSLTGDFFDDLRGDYIED